MNSEGGTQSPFLAGEEKPRNNSQTRFLRGKVSGQKSDKCGRTVVSTPWSRGAQGIGPQPHKTLWTIPVKPKKQATLGPQGNPPANHFTEIQWVLLLHGDQKTIADLEGGGSCSEDKKKGKQQEHYQTFVFRGKTKWDQLPSDSPKGWKSRFLT